MRQLPGGSVDLAFADPPFNIGYDYDVYDDSRESNQYLQWSREWIAEVHRVLKPTGAFWLAIGDEYAAELKVAATTTGFHCRSWVIWYYTFGVHCKLKFTRSHAHLFHFVKDPKKFTFNHEDIRVPSARQLVYADKRANSKGRMPDDTWILRPQDLVNGFTADEDVWYFPRVAGTFKERAGFHGCQMPEQLLARIIRSCSSQGDIVIDPFSGSSTTVAVAKKLGRRWLSFELSPEYAALGRVRLEKIREGDPLDGSPEPQVSAPSTADGRSLHSAKKTRKPIRQNLFEWTPTNEDDVDAIIEAFESVHQGFSVDRVIADPVLVQAFLDACLATGIAMSSIELCRRLFSLRHQGRLAAVGIETTQPTRFTWREQSAYRFASEMAWSQLSGEHANLDLEDFFCDPELAHQFDQLAMRFAPGYRPLEYRWAAITLRKIRVSYNDANVTDSGFDPLASETVLRVTSQSTADFSKVPEVAGCYSLADEDNQLVFIDEVQDLRTRLSQQFGPESPGLYPATKFGSLTVRYVAIANAGDARQSFANSLIQKHQPSWNLGLLV